MTLVQRLLLAPGAFALLAPLAVVNSFVANAAELNINGVSDYAASADQVTSVTQFSDVYPTDWAYQALAGLVETYGCVAGYPNGTFRGNRAMTRFEAAALLNACLDRVTEVTDELRRLMAEFETELAILKGRVDGLEAKVGELQAAQFSTTTKLKGKADFFIGGIDNDVETEGTAGDGEAVVMQYRYRLNMNTSFTGKDLLYTRLQAASGSGWTEAGDTHLADSGSNGVTLSVDKIWYTFPVGDFKVTVGPRIENYYMIETPTRYKPVLKAFKLGGYGSLMGASTGTGAGIQWRQNVGRGEPAFNFAANYTSSGGDDSSEGVFGDDVQTSFLTQLGYGTRKAWVGAHYARKNTDGSAVIAGQSNDGTVSTSMDVWGLRGFYVPESKAFPTVSAGINWGNTDGTSTGDTTETFGYMVGLNWDDVLVEGNKAGLAYGSIGSYITEKKNESVDADNNALEIWYQYQVTDAISVKPAVFWTNNYASDADDTFGALVQTTFKF